MKEISTSNHTLSALPSENSPPSDFTSATLPILLSFSALYHNMILGGMCCRDYSFYHCECKTPTTRTCRPALQLSSCTRNSSLMPSTPHSAPGAPKILFALLLLVLFLTVIKNCLDRPHHRSMVVRRATLPAQLYPVCSTYS